MVTLSATDIDVHELTHFGVRHRGIETAIDDRGEGITFPIGRRITLTDIHTGSEQGGRESFARILIDGFQFARNRLVFRRFEEETDALQVY